MSEHHLSVSRYQDRGALNLSDEVRDDIHKPGLGCCQQCRHDETCKNGLACYRFTKNVSTPGEKYVCVPQDFAGAGPQDSEQVNFFASAFFCWQNSMGASLL